MQSTAYPSRGINPQTRSKLNSKQMDTSSLKHRLKLPIQKLPSSISWNELRPLESYTTKDISSWQQRREFLLWPPNYLRNYPESTFLPIQTWEVLKQNSTASRKTTPTSPDPGPTRTTLFRTTQTFWNRVGGKSKLAPSYEHHRNHDTCTGSTRKRAALVSLCSPTTSQVGNKGESSYCGRQTISATTRNPPFCRFKRGKYSSRILLPQERRHLHRRTLGRQGLHCSGLLRHSGTEWVANPSLRHPTSTTGTTTRALDLRGNGLHW